MRLIKNLQIKFSEINSFLLFFEKISLKNTFIIEPVLTEKSILVKFKLQINISNIFVQF